MHFLQEACLATSNALFSSAIPVGQPLLMSCFFFSILCDWLESTADGSKKLAMGYSCPGRSRHTSGAT